MYVLPLLHRRKQMSQSDPHPGFVFRNECPRSLVKAVTVILPALVCAYGIYAFVKRQLLSYMFLQIMFAFFDFNEARLFFFLDYLSIMILFMFLGCLAVYALSKISGKGKAEER